jgi:hypothetical protein
LEVYEAINEILKAKGMTKREFARQIIAYAPSLKVELIPYMSDILGVSEQELFDWSEKRRVQLLQSILNFVKQKPQKIRVLVLFLKGC